MTEYFDFEDGNGLVPAHRHSNGGGWVADTAYVAPTAYVGPNARVYHNARVCDYVIIYDYSEISGNAEIYNHVTIYKNVKVYDNARVYDDTRIYGETRIFGDSRISGDSKVYGIKRSDGRFFNYWPDVNGVMKVQAGYRDFTMEEAEEHWKKTPLGDETMGILKSLKRLSKVKPEGCV